MLDGNYNATLSVKILSKPATIEASITAEKDKNFIYLGVGLSLLFFFFSGKSMYSNISHNNYICSLFL